MAGHLPTSWGATVEDLERVYPADTMLEDPVIVLTRAVSMAAPTELAYRWLCQLAVAPYSYDLLDNRGHRSPRELTPGADQLEVGQRVMVFQLTEVQPGRQWSGLTYPAASRLFGTVAVTYAVEPVDRRSCRLLCRMAARQGGPFEWVRARLLAWGDLVMMRRQLLNLKRLAERDAQISAGTEPDGRPSASME
jgi:hypothetical protein